jgi:alpha-D-xyloside xylohydrolase
VGEKQNSPLELRIYPGADGRFTLYDDDGLTYGYEKGQRSKVSLVCNEKTGTLTLGARQGTYRNMPTQRKLHVRLLRDQQWTDKDVTYDGRAMSVHFEK